MPAVQLAERKQVERRQQQAEPAGDGDGMQSDRVSGRHVHYELFDQGHPQRAAQLQPFAQAQEMALVHPGQERIPQRPVLEGPFLRHDGGEPQPDDQHGNGHQETGDGARRADVDQRVARSRRAAQPDDCAQRADQRQHRSGDEEWPGRVYPVPTGEDEVAHLVRQQDGEQRGGEGEPVMDRLGPRRRRKLRVGPQRARQEGRRRRQGEEEQVQERRPEAAQRAGKRARKIERSFTHTQLRSTAPMRPEGNRRRPRGPGVFARLCGGAAIPPACPASAARGRGFRGGARRPHPT